MSDDIGVESTGEGVRQIELERKKQLSKGFTPQHDHEEHSFEELVRAGACFTDAAASELEGAGHDWPHPFWPEGSTLSDKLENSALENAIKGAAYVSAAIDLYYAQAFGEVQ